MKKQDQGSAEVQNMVCIQLYLQATDNGDVKATAFPTLKGDLSGLWLDLFQYDWSHGKG